MLQFQTLGGGFRCKSEYPWCIIEVKSKHFPTVFKKMTEKTGIFTQNHDECIDFTIMCVFFLCLCTA
ncbi:Uncharacterized protein FWK35_00014013 [Aphis craccivora]|uniref:Uncharacterized protein n=1 Tax=Aphis craccivora TaxID=307492 RepID=A0A6G0Z6H5_APHCR|nr:Uncharacterized protein FWK35_00014013 [Aphis craccivora]